MSTQYIDAKILKTWLDNGEALLIDVREPEENHSSRIPSSINIPLAMLRMNALPERGNKKLVLHCKTGKRSSDGCEKLCAENPDLEVYCLEGGMDAWMQERYPVHGYDQPDILSFNTMPVSTQNQLILGAVIVLGSLLALVVNNAWALIPGGIGAVMLYEGLTGTNLIDGWLDKLPFRK